MKLHLSLKISLLVVTMFVSASIQAQVVKLKSRTERSVSIMFPAFTGDVSQYILERSVDGKRFQEIAEFVTVMSNEEPYYEFTDRFKSPYNGPLFYRVRVEGLDGGVVYTPITFLKAVETTARLNN